MSQPGMCSKVVENSTVTTVLGMVLVLVTLVLVVIGMGMSPVHMWLVIAVIVLAWLSLCRCINWQKKATQWWTEGAAALPRQDIATVSSGVPSGLAATGVGGRPCDLRDAPPSYDSLTVVVDQPPSYTAAVAKMAAPAEHKMAAASVPPPYGSVAAVAESGGVARLAAHAQGKAAS